MEKKKGSDEIVRGTAQQDICERCLGTGEIVVQTAPDDEIIHQCECQIPMDEDDDS